MSFGAVSFGVVIFTFAELFGLTDDTHLIVFAGLRLETIEKHLVVLIFHRHFGHPRGFGFAAERPVIV